MDANVKQEQEQEQVKQDTKLILLLGEAGVRLVTPGDNIENATLKQCAKFGAPDVAVLVWTRDNAEAR